jgi:hypothetical protein
MIRLTVKIGSGDRQMPEITDDLISSATMAMRRAQQELAASTYIVKKETLNMPHDPGANPGTISEEFAYKNLGIFGRFFVTDLNIELSPDSARDTMTAERYGRMIL